ncbi:hypothetical protein NHE_0175 [Neorickettsia helminthoeca str. Oregon]|uniref:AI-2E family transporter n=1 Tax=Neorickettsia helminthoeca str. Oregon TaxID=1286528 RepID=X5HL94_9RICK|nr:AI-2E family transporter [Neorickettsia helminthoeca]AHX11140.1 hypothetical protein NHE_0175 [Neorickettsia helminthoeca str. Oregon]
MLLAFVFAFIFACFLEGYTTKLAIMLGSRKLASFFIVTLLSILVVIILSLALPLLYHQLILFLSGAPQLLASINKHLQTVAPNLYNFLETQGIASVLDYTLALLPQLSSQITQHLWDSTLAVANGIILVIFTPLITFYLLDDWPVIVSSVREMVPLRYRKAFKIDAQLISASISGYLSGQAKISLILAILYTVLLFFAGLPYYFLIGVSTGILTIIPYLGNITGLVIAHLVAFSNASNVLDVLPITLIFIACGITESMILSPKLLSKSVNLHPLWIIFAITIGGILFGFTGILLAVPFASIAAGFVRLGVAYYKESSYYIDETVDTH